MPSQTRREPARISMTPYQSMIPPAFAELPFGEKLVLWAVRLWVRAHADDAGAHEFLNTGFKLAGAKVAYPALDGLMTVLATAGYGNIDIRMPNCAEISHGEHRILGAIAAWQQGHGAERAGMYLACWLPPAALRLAQDPLRMLAETLGMAGLLIRPRAEVETNPAAPVDQSAVNTSHRTFH